VGKWRGPNAVARYTVGALHSITSLIRGMGLETPIMD